MDTNKVSNVLVTLMHVCIHISLSVHVSTGPVDLFLPLLGSPPSHSQTGDYFINSKCVIRMPHD